jgi:two-component system OmpR family sensor kinase
MESGVQHQEFQQVSLNTLIKEIIEDAHIEAQTKRISITMSLKQQIIVEVQPSLLHRAIENIIRNAIKYSGEATEITLSLHETPSMLELHINDQGPGINELELEQVFKPFYRAGQRRENDSVGLGLAIAYRAVKTHGGYIKASNRVVGGLCVTVYLPKTLIVTN